MTRSLPCDATERPRSFKHVLSLKKRATSIASTLCVAAVSTIIAGCGGGSDSPVPQTIASQLFAQTNDTVNAVAIFTRNADGTIKPNGVVPTGGAGTNGVSYFMGNAVTPDALTSNYSVITSPDHTKLFVANAGDNTVSTFTINPAGGITLLAVSGTGGIRPTSLAFANGVLYVTHQQGAKELGAYRVGSDGKLTSIGQYTVVQQDALPTQVALSPDGKYIIVNGFLKTVNPVVPANALLAYPIAADGTLGAPITSTSSGVGPFGGRFGFGSLDKTYVVAEAAGATVSSYSWSPTNAAFSAQSGPVGVSGQAAPCWLNISADNQHVYVSSGSGAISEFALDSTGRLTLVNASVASEPATQTGASASSFANDSWISSDGKYFYQDYAGDGKIVVYAISAVGSLSKLGEEPVKTNALVSLQGLAGT